MVGIRSGSSGTGIRAPHFEGAVCSPVQECCAWGPGRSNAQSLPLVTLTPYGGPQRRSACPAPRVCVRGEGHVSMQALGWSL